MNDQQEWKSLLLELNDCGVYLSDWEEEFIDSMLKIADEGKNFSVNQGRKIEEIYKRKLGGR